MMLEQQPSGVIKKMGYRVSSAFQRLISCDRFPPPPPLSVVSLVGFLCTMTVLKKGQTTLKLVFVEIGLFL